MYVARILMDAKSHETRMTQMFGRMPFTRVRVVILVNSSGEHRGLEWEWVNGENRWTDEFSVEVQNPSRM
jgi:hypothetical protein